jgi:putative ABC transport system permease protein
MGPDVSEVLVLAEENASVSRLREDLGTALGASYDVASSQDTAAASASAAKSSLSYLRVMLFALAGAALFVGGFLIANTFSIVISQRTRELAVLRSAGATGRQVVASVWAEALLLGGVGSAVGVGLGVLAASGLREVVGAFGIALPETGMVVLPRSLATAFLVGLVVTAVAAAGPSRRAAKTAPVAAMRDSAVPAGLGRRRLVAGWVTASLALVLLAVVVLTSAPALLVAPGAVLALVALGLLGPGLAPRISRAVGRPLDALGVPGTMARQSATRAPRRTAATVMALAVSLGLVGFMTVLAGSINGSIAKAYEETISADFVVESARAEMLGGLAPSVYGAVADLDEVVVASRLRYGHWKEGQATRALTAIDPVSIDEVADLDLVEGSLDELAGGGIMLAETTARERGLDVGDEVAMTFSRAGKQSLEVVAVLDDNDAQALSTAYLIGIGTFERLFSESVDASLFVRTAEGVAASDAAKALDEALAAFPTADVRDQAAAVDERTAAVDQVLGLVTVLLLFTVLIALLGITNTLALSIVERTREIGLLRAVGMTRAQLRRMVRGEAALTAAVAVVVGLGLGLSFAAAVVAALGRSGPVELEIPLVRLLMVLVGATAGGLLAGLLPARRAARLDVLEAIGAE